MSNLTKCLLPIFLLYSFSMFSQDCESILNIQLYNIRGGVFAGQEVKLVSTTDGTVITQKSDYKGIASFHLPCNVVYDMSISNNTDSYQLMSHPAGGTMNQSLSYEPNMKELDEIFAMNATEKALVDKEAINLPDTNFLTNARMRPQAKADFYSHVTIVLKNVEKEPLIGETLVFSGTKRNKHIKAKTDGSGTVELYVLKGDEYSLNFELHKNYAKEEIDYKKGTENITLQYTYLGTKEIKRRQEEEAIRIKEEEERIKRERERFEEECKRREMDMKDVYSERLLFNEAGADTVVSAVLNRNKWLGKLIVCDITGSMSPYVAQLYRWYAQKIETEKNLQFVFFNDGDNKSSSEKIIGETGGIYYTNQCGLDSLVSFMSHVSVRGSGGDCPENNMEALIKGVDLAQPYQELVMIVDNNAPVKDIELLENFNRPVRIILCGATSGWVLEDYLQIAWKTKGSIHTIEEDFTSIGNMSEGQYLTIDDTKYQIMGGSFFRLNDR